MYLVVCSLSYELLVKSPDVPGCSLDIAWITRGLRKDYNVGDQSPRTDIARSMFTSCYGN